MFRIYMTAMLLMAAAGCIHESPVVVYETERISLTLEGKADATEPIAGNLGFKQRVVAVLPGMEKEGDEDGEDALSVISYFEFTKHEDPTRFWRDPIVVRTAFVTGDAASEAVTVGTSGAIYKGLAGGQGTAMLGLSGLVLAADGLKASDDADQNALGQRLDKVAQLLPEKYPVEVYELQSDEVLQVAQAAGDDVQRTTFRDVNVYADTLSQSMLAIDDILRALDEGKAVVDPDGSAIAATDTEGRQALRRRLQTARAKQAAALSEIMDTVRNAPAVRDASRYLYGQ